MRQSYVPRGWLISFQVIGTIFAVLGLAVYISQFSQIASLLGRDNADGKALAALFLAMLVYLAWKTIYTAIVIIGFIKKSSDDDISANRYIISALSLNLGGFMTPFAVTMLPNVATRSTINPRWFLTRTMGITSLVGGALALIAFFTGVLSGQNSLTSAQVFDTTQTAGAIGVGVLVAGIVVTLFGMISVVLFYQKSSHQIFENGDTGFASFMNFIAIIWLAVLTVELFMTMLFAIIRLLGALADLISAMGSDGWGKTLWIFMALINLVFTIAYVGYVLYLTSRAMVGIWSKDGVEYKPYESLLRAQNSRKQKLA